MQIAIAYPPQVVFSNLTITVNSTNPATLLYCTRPGLWAVLTNFTGSVTFPRLIADALVTAGVYQWASNLGFFQPTNTDAVGLIWGQTPGNWTAAVVCTGTNQTVMFNAPTNYVAAFSVKGGFWSPPSATVKVVGNAIVPALMFRTNQTNGVRPTLTIAKQ